MNTVKNYYLIVPVKDVFMKEKKGNIITADGNKATDIFNEHNIPIEFQKIVLKISIGGIYTPKDAFELVTNEMFCFKTPVIKALLKQKQKEKLELLSYNAEIFTNISFYHADKVKEFYQKIINAGLALNYEKATYHILGKEYKQENNLSKNKILKKEYL